MAGTAKTNITRGNRILVPHKQPFTQDPVIDFSSMAQNSNSIDTPCYPGCKNKAQDKEKH